MRSGRFADGPRGERGARGLGERRAGPVGKRDPSSVLDPLQQAVHRECVDERRDRRRVRWRIARQAPQVAPSCEGNAQTGQAAATRGSPAAHASHSRRSVGACDAQLAALRQRTAHNVPRVHRPRVQHALRAALRSAVK